MPVVRGRRGRRRDDERKERVAWWQSIVMGIMVRVVTEVVVW